jgi:hypothetical protein
MRRLHCLCCRILPTLNRWSVRQCRALSDERDGAAIHQNHEQLGCTELARFRKGGGTVQLEIFAAVLMTLLNVEARIMKCWMATRRLSQARQDRLHLLDLGLLTADDFATK